MSKFASFASADRLYVSSRICDSKAQDCAFGVWVSKPQFSDMAYDRGAPDTGGFSEAACSAPSVSVSLRLCRRRSSSSGMEPHRKNNFCCAIAR